VVVATEEPGCDFRIANAVSTDRFPDGLDPRDGCRRFSVIDERAERPLERGTRFPFQFDSAEAVFFRFAGETPLVGDIP
jgi:hypothetical protein